MGMSCIQEVSNLETLQSNVALVIGAGGGIGAAVCQRLASQGLTIVACDIDKDRASSAIANLDGKHHARSFDISSEAGVVDAFDDVERNIGAVRVVVVAAGLLLFEDDGARPLIKSTRLEMWERSMAVNATGVFLCAREFVNHREKRPVAHGRFITFGSVAAQLGGYRSSASYIASKAAVMGFTKAFARETADLGITVNCVAPGLIDTEMLRSTVQSAGAMQETARNIPLGRIGTVDDVAAAVAYLASEDASYVTGSVIDVNGGYRMQ
mgnify:CR=1 FL=1|jgi:Dehydrogenases with different specificities (related to short-chain alcohol dehydrogenases)